MRYEVTVFDLSKGKKILIWSINVEAKNLKDAIIKADVDLKEYRVMEIQKIYPIDHPKVKRVSREGVI